MAAEAPDGDRRKPAWTAKNRPEASVRGTELPARPRPADPAERRTVKKLPRPVPPRAAGAEITLTPGARTATAVPGTPLTVRAAGARGPRKLRVDVLEPAVADRAGVDGLLFRVVHTDGLPAAVPVTVGVDYSGFRAAYGGDYAARLHLVRLPACAATTPKLPACGRGTPLTTRNDIAGSTISGAVTATAATRGAAPDAARRTGTPAPAAALYAVTSGPNGAAGSFKPSSLAPSALWQVGLQSGEFTWSYPLTLPSVPGIEPDLALSYASGSVDGRTASTNNQPSWAGEGFDLQPGFIERQYTGCAGDTAGGNNTTATGDLCYASRNATVALPGVAGELVWDAAKQIWRAEEDDGWRVEQLFGAANGDNDGEYWRMTSPDGTQYYFGRTTAAKSAWTVPVYGNHSGEPCHAASYATSWCQQAYRWMLDHVVNRDGDIMTYTYDTETNHYGRAGDPAAATPYVRAGHLTRIDYGLRQGQTEPDARVLFGTADRCLPGSACRRTVPSEWPDVPWDQQCDGGNCAGRTSPVFFGSKRLDKVTAQIRHGGAFQDVTSWQLRHTYPATGDGTSPALWLASVTRTGHAGSPLSEPPVDFDGERLPNRLSTGGGLQPLNKWRVRGINNETGGRTEVSYTAAACNKDAPPPADRNGLNCFPGRWVPAGGTLTQLDWFHKYLATEVREIDRVGGSPDEVTSYEYVGDAAWRHDEAELVPEELKTWGQWRGYQAVKVRTGAVGGVRTLTEHRFYRGMHGDKNADGTTKNVVIAGKQDKPTLRGFAHEEITYNGDGGPEIERTISEPVEIGPTAERSRPTGTLSAYTTEVKQTYTRTALAGGGNRETRETHEYDQYGVNHRTHDQGDLADPDDDTCTAVSHTPNLTDWIVGAPYRVETIGRPCGTAAQNAGDVISDVRTYYDGSTTLATAPSRARPTKVEELSEWSAGGGTYTTVSRHGYDAHGRETEEWDALGNRDETVYTPATGGPVTEVRAVNALGHISTDTLHPLLGVPTATTGPDGLRTSFDHDALGRFTRGWAAGRPVTQSPDAEISYLVRADGPTAVTSRTLLAGGQYRASYTLYDGFLRKRQTQEPSPIGGRIVGDTLYDGHGRVAKVSELYHNAGAPGTTVLATLDPDVPAQKEYVFDGAGRETAEIDRAYGAERWRTTTTYGGNWTREDPPQGGTSATTYTDAHDRRTELRQHKNATEYDTTRYTYTKSGSLATVTDPAGNVWRHFYDVRGRETRTEDPDKGTLVTAYDDEDRPLSVTDARGRTVRSVYDALGRRTATHENSTSGPKLTETVYDTLAKGKQSASIRYAGGQAYRSDVIGYDGRGRSTGTAVTIPASEGALAGRYESLFTYNDVSQHTATTLPGAGGLPAETLVQGFDELGLAATLTGLDPYVNMTGYDPLGGVEEYILGSLGRQLRQSFVYESGTRRLTVARTEQEGLPAPTVERTFTYNPAGNITKLTTAALGRDTDTQCYGTDYLQRLTEAWTPAGDCTAPPTTAGLAGPAPYWHSYTFDATGNRLGETWRSPAGNTTRTYSYPAPGSARPHALQSVTHTGPGGTRTDSYAYDADGNTTARNVNGTSQTLAWNAEGLLESVGANGQATEFLYSAEGERLLRREPGATTLSMGATELKLNTATQTVTGTRSYTMHGATVAVRTPSGLTWLSADHHGTGETAVDDTTQQASHRLHLPYGGPRGTQPGSWPTERGFVGGTSDASTGLTHLGARDYDPLTGRFVSVDPIIDHNDPQQMNGYAYANNNPVSFTDPDGLKAKKKTKKPPAKHAKKPGAKKPQAKQHTTKPVTGECHSREQCRYKENSRAGNPKPKTKAASCPTGRSCKTGGPGTKRPVKAGTCSSNVACPNGVAPAGNSRAGSKKKGEQGGTRKPGDPGKYFDKAAKIMEAATSVPDAQYHHYKKNPPTNKYDKLGFDHLKKFKLVNHLLPKTLGVAGGVVAYAGHKANGDSTGEAATKALVSTGAGIGFIAGGCAVALVFGCAAGLVFAIGASFATDWAIERNWPK
ncbi:RHS repeat-associated core domain-containing protein [Streptomyces sp. NPDC003691]